MKKILEEVWRFDFEGEKIVDVYINALRKKSTLMMKNTFILAEFDTVITSYENMLKRLKSQTNAQAEFVNNASYELNTVILHHRGYVNFIKRWGIENKDELINNFGKYKNTVIVSRKKYKNDLENIPTLQLKYENKNYSVYFTK